jgi:hypothetical protein
MNKTILFVCFSLVFLGLIIQVATAATGTVYWSSRDASSGFENGTLNIAKDGYGQVWTEGSGSETVVTSPVYKGAYAVKLASNQRAQICRWGEDNPNGIRNLDDAYYGWAFYLGPGYSVNVWNLIAQLHTVSPPGEDHGEFAQLELTSGANPRLFLATKIDGAYKVLWTDSVAAPQGKWFTVVMHLVAKTASNGGKVELWVNKDPLNSPGAGTYMGSWSRDFSSHAPYPGPGFCSDVYQQPGGPTNWAVVDEMVAASTLDKVVEFLSPTSSATTSSSTATTSSSTTTMPAAIVVKAPNGGESWYAGTKHTLTWSYTGAPGSSVKIELLKSNSVYRVITSSTSLGSNGMGSYSWTIPSSQTWGSDYRIRITSTTNSRYTDTSNSYFQIRT